MTALRARLLGLLAALDHERRLLGALDVAGVLAAAGEKQRLLDELQLPALADPDSARLARRVRASARANALLLNDVIAALSGRAAVDSNAGVYDARARRLSAAPRAYSGRVI